MFEISELRWITRLIGAPFYLSPRSTFEYIVFNDIDHFELIVDFDVVEWLLETKSIHRLKYEVKNDQYQVHFINENLTFTMVKKKDSIENYLKSVMFNVHGVVTAITHIDHNSFDHYVTSKNTFYASWVDPFHKRLSIKAGYIEPIDVQSLLENGQGIMEMVLLMAEHNFDLHHELIHYIQMKSEDIHLNAYINSAYLFKLFSYPNASKYLKILDDLNLCDKIYPVILDLKQSIVGDETIWHRGLECLAFLEKVLYSDDYFVDSVSRTITRALNSKLSCGLSRRQMIKFSTLFYHAYRTMKLKMNSPERYEATFESFCDIFELQSGACEYYSKVIQNNCDAMINLKEALLQGNVMRVEKQYEFYEEFQDYTIDVLLMQFVDQMCEFQDGLLLKDRFEYLIKGYISKFCEVQSINSEITTLEIDLKTFSDTAMIVLLEDVKKKIFMGNLRYDRQTIIEYINEVISKT